MNNAVQKLTIGITYDLRDDYLKEGYTHEETAEFDLPDTIEAIEKVIIDKLEENTFHAKIIIKVEGGQTKTIDARPSDSIALAVRFHAPIFVEDAIINQYEMFSKDK